MLSQFYIETILVYQNKKYFITTASLDKPQPHQISNTKKYTDRYLYKNRSRTKYSKRIVTQTLRM